MKTQKIKNESQRNSREFKKTQINSEKLQET